jgi:hypothetical protein
MKNHCLKLIYSVRLIFVVIIIDYKNNIEWRRYNMKTQLPFDPRSEARLAAVEFWMGDRCEPFRCDFIVHLMSLLKQ